MILRLYDCTSGRILIDDHDIRDYTLDSLRGQINVVQQDNMLFSTSVVENITYGAIVNEKYSSREPTTEEIQSVSRLANAHNFINSLPNGYETVLAERGLTLSRGQRQRIALARAALGNAPILILDEPTTGLDEENERLVMESIRRLEKDCTVLLITHNLKYASRSDLILFLDKGELVESGTHDERLTKYLPPTNSVGIHRDFYHDQILIGKEKLYLLDFDMYCEGDPSLDVGNFIGHLKEFSLRKFGNPNALSRQENALIERFIELSGEFRRTSVEIYTTLTLVRHISISQQFSDRRKFTKKILSLCEKRLQSQLSQLQQ